VSAFSTTIEAKGFKVLRFSNRDVMTNRVGVLETIATAVAERAPTSTLPRRRRREKSAPMEKNQP
jgi:very-short-patch-repair endonuclease